MVGHDSRRPSTRGLSAAQLTEKPEVSPAPTLTQDWNDIVYATATLVDDNGTVIRIEGDLTKAQALEIASSLS